MSERKVFHPNATRGLADHGWLVSHHTFSFADYYDPQRMNFGLLRVLNDDSVAPGMGFSTHPHDNMEIISIPLSGTLQHADSMGNAGVVETGEVQLMSAGSGLTHSEYNASQSEELNFLQIWILPKERNIAPRYGQRRFAPAARHNRFQTLVAPESSAQTIRINQDAWLSLADLSAGATVDYQKHRPEDGIYCFVIEGDVTIDGEPLVRRDGLGLTEGRSVQVATQNGAQLLCIEVPLTAIH